MNKHTCSSILLILVILTLTSCGGRSGKDAPALKLQIEPAPGVYIQYYSQSSIFRIGNELVERRISVNREAHLVSTVAFINKLSGRNYIRSLSEEFSFRANGVGLSGVTGNLEYMDHETFGAGGVKGLVIRFQIKQDEIGILRLRLVYEIYPHTPVIRKWMEMENPAGSSITIDSVKVESLNLMPGSEYDLEIYNNQRSSIHSPIVFDTRLTEGFFVGNEAPGILKHSDLYSNRSSMFVGMKQYFHNHAVGISLSPDEEFISPAVFIFMFKGDPAQSEEVLSEFVAEYLARSRIGEHFIWYENVAVDLAEPEAHEKMQLAAKSGAEIFCVNGRWLDGNDHLESLSQYALSLGMKFGLSIKLAVSDPDSQVITEYPQWAVKLEDGSDYTIDNGKMMCLGSEYAVYAAQEIDRLVRDLDLGYIRLTGPIIPDEESGGCFAQDHVHRSSAESLWYIYEGFFALCEYLHSQHPDLIIDVLPGSYNPEWKTDYALLKHVDVKWPF